MRYKSVVKSLFKPIFTLFVYLLFGAPTSSRTLIFKPVNISISKNVSLTYQPTDVAGLCQPRYLATIKANLLCDLGCTVKPYLHHVVSIA